ncbi:dnaJsubfamily C member 2-like [Abeliophyllum distichum]|uniref:DnaJsubfamily C member 2-like n=1 Tax=Abeliophyllum distichum TaxID=126358 RepID=A0ABD1P3J1_9LAMI
MKENEGLERYEVLKKVLRLDHKLKDEKQDKKKLQSNDYAVANEQDIFSSHEKREKPWSKDEIELLRKGMQKYPKGTSRRWEVVTEFIRWLGLPFVIKQSNMVLNRES